MLRIFALTLIAFVLIFGATAAAAQQAVSVGVSGSLLTQADTSAPLPQMANHSPPVQANGNLPTLQDLANLPTHNLANDYTRMLLNRRNLDQGLRSYVASHRQWTTGIYPFVINSAGLDSSLMMPITGSDASPLRKSIPVQVASLDATRTIRISSARVNIVADLYVPTNIQTFDTGLAKEEALGNAVATMLANGFTPTSNIDSPAACSFQDAQSFAFVSDVGARNRAMGYWADINKDDDVPQIA